MEMLAELCWVRVIIKLGKSEPLKAVEVMVGEIRFQIQLWWDFSPFLKVVSSPKQRRNFIFYRDDDGGAHAGERESEPRGKCDAVDCKCSRRRA